ncbi:MAG TPA: thioredoxin fold domain-containing protein, partial [Candidatus Berkiella sp.]|nr:thioredoxin fold domain-containing protein [Candidatus Berkiella sp.]
QQAFNEANQDKAIEGSICPDRSVARGYELGGALGISGTPTMVFEDGTLFPGYLPPEKLLEAVKQIHQQAIK